MKREELIGYLDNLLEAGRLRDYCPNGLQVEGRTDVQRLVAGVTACQAPVSYTHLDVSKRQVHAQQLAHAWPPPTTRARGSAALACRF